MANDRHVMRWLIAVAVVCGAASLAAQDRKVMAHWEVGSVDASENVPPITGAPFSADATTEFAQVLTDGNRIEQQYSTSVARDGRGRTRREQEMALVGPLAVLQPEPLKANTQAGGGRGRALWLSAPGPQRVIVITDPVEQMSYTLDEQRKEARRSAALVVQRFEDLKVLEVKLKRVAADTLKALEAEKAAAARAGGGAQQNVVVEELGTRQIEGVAAKGTRTTTTIPAGAIGNLAPINMVTERWFSEELGMAVRITRNDPRSGETVYRLTNIVRAEPPPDLFTVPPDYKIVEPLYDKKVDEYKKAIDAGRGGGGRGRQ